MRYIEKIIISIEYIEKIIISIEYIEKIIISIMPSAVQSVVTCKHNP